MEYLQEIWALVLVPTVAAIGAVYGFAKTYLEKQRLQLEIARLQHEAVARDGRIHQPTAAEVAQYGRPRAGRRQIVITAVVGCVALSVVAILTGRQLQSSATVASANRADVEATKRLVTETQQSIRRTEAQLAAAQRTSLEQTRLIRQELEALSRPQPSVNTDDTLAREIGRLRGDVTALSLKADEVNTTITQMGSEMSAATADVEPLLREGVQHLEVGRLAIEKMAKTIESIQQQQTEIREQLRVLQAQRCPPQ